MNSLIVTATRWSGGWELEIGEQQHTQVRNLCNARQQVVDYLDTMDESVDHADVD
ncbi:antitoxin HicB, partial [Cutibacterium acnes subsp. acnes]|nr:antitoxin HicB [Cutibacterium acnes subsp. acnes]